MWTCTAYFEIAPQYAEDGLHICALFEKDEKIRVVRASSYNDLNGYTGVDREGHFEETRGARPKTVFSNLYTSIGNLGTPITQVNQGNPSSTEKSS